MTARLSSSILALALVGALSACGGAGSGDGAGGGNNGPTTPVAGSDLTTMQRNLGITAGVDKAMRGAITTEGRQQGAVRVEVNPARMSAGYGDFQTPIVSSTTPTSVVMNGEVSRVNGVDSTFYIPRTGSDVHVGMMHRVSGDAGMVGIFGNETSASAIGARAAAGGTATYAGQAEYSQEVGIQTAGYRGQITATANFDNAGLTYGTGAMGKFTDTGGAASMRVNGTGRFAANGEIVGTYTTTPSSGTGASGDTSGAFYGPTGQNIGLIFSGSNGAGGAILNEAN